MILVLTRAALIHSSKDTALEDIQVGMLNIHTHIVERAWFIALVDGDQTNILKSRLRTRGIVPTSMLENSLRLLTRMLTMST